MEKNKEQNIKLQSQNCILRGKLIFPTKYDGVKGKKFPLVIMSHGFGSCMKETKSYAEVFVSKGYAAIIFDFCRSGFRCKSTGKTTEMSILTQKQDLLDLLDWATKLEMIDSSSIILAGCSQGGFVSALAAVEAQDKIKSLVMYYPALCIPDDARRGCMINARFNPDNVPETFHALYLKLSSKYVEDARGLDPYKQICSFKKKVLIVHGIEDKLVNIEYSRKASKLYSDCTLVEVHGDHGFFRNGFEASAKATERFLESL